MPKARESRRFIRKISLPHHLNIPVRKPLLIRVVEVVKAVKKVGAEMGNADPLYVLGRLDHLYRAMMLRWQIGRNLGMEMKGSKSENDTLACEMMSYGNISRYIWRHGCWPVGLINCLHSFGALRCIGWSVSVVYKVRKRS